MNHPFVFPPLPESLEPAYVLSPLRVRLTLDLLGEFTEHVNAECTRPDRKSHAERLVGQIDNGEQIDTTASLPPKFRELFCQLGRLYISRLAEVNRCVPPANLRVAFVDSWIVKSRAGDYNPAHSHTGLISGIVYVKVPPQVADPATTAGKLDFLHGHSDELNLQFWGPRQVTPAVGDIYLFPAWLTHIVYPFQGPGERISYSFNLKAAAD